MEDFGVMFFAEAIGAWLLGRAADAGHKRLFDWVLDSDQERALRQAANAAIQRTAEELCPEEESVEHLAVVVDQVFREPVPVMPSSEHASVLEALEATVAGQLAVLDDDTLTGIGVSSAALFGVSAEQLANTLVRRLLDEVQGRGARGGPLTALADQLNHDLTRRQIQRLQGAGAQWTDARVGRLAYGREVAHLLDFYTELFVGREQELRQLIALVATEKSGYAMVEAPAGYGKSALLAQLVHRCASGHWDGSATPTLAYFFVREEGLRHTPEAFCLAVNSQLLDLLGLPGGVPPELEAQRIQLLDLWAEANRAACAEQPLLLVVDGMDEMALGAVTIADLLPTELGPYVHVLVSSRPNPVPMQQVWPEHPLRAAVVLPLHELESVEMSALLVRQGSAPEVALALADRMVEVTGGEPLLSRFVAQDVAAGGEDMLERLERDPPAGVRDYFLRQFSQLDARAAGRTAWDVLGLLLVARGGMALEDLAAVLDMPVRNVNHAIEPIRRFLLGNDRLELMHDEFRVVLTANFSPRERAEYRRRLRHWSASFGAAGWPDDTPDYVLDSYAALLREEDLHEALYALIDQRWMQLRAARTGSYHAFAQDILLMIAAAAAKTPPDLGQQLRGVHIYVTLGSMARSLPAVALGVLARAGQVTLAEGYADLINEAGAKSSAYCHVATGLVRRGEIREAVEAIRRALVAAEAISLEELQVQALAQVAATMAEAGRPEQASDPIALALGAAEAISTEDRRIQALAQVAAAMADVGQGEQAALFAEEALEAIEADPDLYDNQAVLGAVAVVLAKTGQVAQAVDLAARARAAASSFPDDSLRSVVLALINTGHSAEAEILAGRARAAAEEIIDDSFRAGALAEVAVALAEAGQAPQAVAVAEDARRLAEVSSGWLGNSVLERVALALATVGQGELACAAANAIPSDSHRSQALAAVAGALADGGRLVQAVELAKETLAATEAIPSEETRSRALAQTIKDLAAAGQVENAVALAERVRNLAEAVPDRQFRAEALAELAVMLAEMRQTKSASSLCEEVLDLARAIRYDESRVQVHAKMVSVLGMTGQLDRAVALAETIGSVAAGISSHWSRARALTAVAVGLANAGQPERASVLAEQAMIAAQAEHGSSRALEEVTAALARTGLVEHALEAAEAIPSDWARTRALAKVAVALAREGRPEQVMVLANRIRILTETMPDDWFAVEALAGAVAALAAAGQAVQAVHFAEQANRLADGIAYKDSRVRILAQLASAMISLGRVERAAALAKDALQVAEHIPEVAGVRALMDAAGILARAGQAEQAQTVASRAMTPTAVTDRFAFFDLLPLVLRVIRSAEGDATTQVDMAGVVVETERWWSVSSDVIPEVNLEI